MRRIRKIGALVLLSFALSAPLYANMPVIDISAIAEGISQFMTTIEQYNRQIQQWKSEYDKMVHRPVRKPVRKLGQHEQVR